jgi:hypothetical protein
MGCRLFEPTTTSLPAGSIGGRTRAQAQNHLATMYREMGMTYWLEKAEGEVTKLGR